MKSNFKITALIAVLIFAASSVTNGQYRQYMRVNNRMSYPGQCMDIPGLTADQKEKITAINAAHQKAIDDMRADFYAAEDVMLANEIKSKMTLEQNNHLKQVSDLLNEEQLKYFNENIVVGPAGRGRAVNRVGRGGTGYGYINGRGLGRGPSGMGYGNMNGRGRGRGYGQGMGYRYLNGRR